MSDTRGGSEDGRSVTAAVRVIVVDDEALVRSGFRVLIDLEPDMTVVGEAGDGSTAVELTRRTRPDVVLMDIRMPELDGIQATRLITTDPDLSGVHVLVLTTFDHDDHVIDALGAGAAGFLIKNTEPRQLLNGIRVVAGGEALLSPGLTRRLIARLVERSVTPRVDSAALARLTTRERELVGLVAHGLSNADIAAVLTISHTTAKTHIGRAMTKLGARDRAQLVTLAYQHRLVEPPDPPQRAV